MKRLFLFFLIVFSTASQSSPASIYIAYPEEIKNYKEIAKKIESDLKKNGIKNIRTLSSDKIKKENIKATDLTIFLGEKASKEHKGIKSPSIFSFASKIKKEELETGQQWSIVNTNQPAKKLLKTAEKTINKEYKKNILFIISEENLPAIKELSFFEKHENVKTIIVKNNERAAKSIEPELFNAAAIIAIYDPKIWSGNSARWILQQAYSHQVPVIGYSKAFLKAGAMVSVYSSADQIIEAINSQVLKWVNTGTLETKTIYPSYSIEVNDNIARALDFSKAEIIEIGNHNDF